MLIMVGRYSAININRLKIVQCMQHDDGSGKRTYSVNLQYKDIDDHDAKYDVTGFSKLEEVEGIKNSVVAQAKEAEMERVSMMLEDAIKNGGTT